MKKNIGKADRIVRLVLAVSLLIIAYFEMSWLLAIMGAFVLYEAMSSWCALYALIGRNTCPLDTKL